MEQTTNVSLGQDFETVLEALDTLDQPAVTLGWNSYRCIILGSNLFKQKTEQIYSMLDPIFMQHNMQIKF